jgi:hypothetical protein
VEPAQGQPTTMLAFEAAVIDWLPARGFRHDPGSLGTSTTRPEIRLQSAPLHQRESLTSSGSSFQSILIAGGPMNDYG